MQNSVLFNLIRKHREAEDLLWQELHRRNVSWKTYAKEGFKAKAVFTLRDKYKCPLLDAKRAVDEYLTD